MKLWQYSVGDVEKFKKERGRKKEAKLMAVVINADGTISLLRSFSEICSTPSPSYLKISLPARSDGWDNADGSQAGASLRTQALSCFDWQRLSFMLSLTVGTQWIMSALHIIDN
jgi:hypothetical protein